MIALFDLDGTLLPWDTQKLFCHHVLRRYPRRRWLMLLYLATLPAGPWLKSAGLKRAFLCFLWRLPQSDVEALAQEFASQWFPHACWPVMRDRIAQHQRAGDTLVLISASPAPYVEAIGRLLGFDHAFGTELEKTEPTALFPHLVNNKGEEKMRRLRRELPHLFCAKTGHLIDSHGYSDSCADLPMLEQCQHATVVNPSPRLRRIAEARSWEILSLPRPWNNRRQRMHLRLRCLRGSRNVQPLHWDTPSDD